MKMYKFSQSTFIYENNVGKRILVDPGKHNYSEDFKPNNFEDIDFLIITHKHADHYDLEAIKIILNQNELQIITNSEIASLLQNEGIKADIVKPGDTILTMGYRIFIIQTDHVVQGEEILNFGFVLEADSKKVYYTSDTRFIDVSQLPEVVQKSDILCVPISDRGVVMSIDDALYFADQLQPNVIVPMHYDSPKDNDKNRVQPRFFIERKLVLDNIMDHLSEIESKVMEFGEIIQV